ncbi:GNAT family N-acetyltransferase [Candidatus Woesearchaeota archaeon]|nr:GNAT family N-acetyltransferase [Candidatus Woesearchaeota archaeon]
MPEIRILTAEDREEWKKLVEMLPVKDIFYSQDYLEINADAAGFKAEMFVYEEGDNMILYPYLKKPIHVLPFLEKQKDNKKMYDITTLEYGGPAARLSDEVRDGGKQLFKEFKKEFNRYCRQNSIITEWARLHPFIENHKLTEESEHVKDVYYINLSRQEDEIVDGFEKRNRNSISKSKRSGVTVKRSKDRDNLDAFYSIYCETMDRRKAEGFYYYSRDFFDDLIRKLGDSVQLFLAKHDGKTIGASFFLAENDIVHYYLSGMDHGYSRYCPNNIILKEAILWAKNKGFRIFNLGGGYSAGDSLSKFKSGFSSTQVPFYRYTKVHNKEAYESLCELKRSYDKEKNIKGDPHYFPLYRGKT